MDNLDALAKDLIGNASQLIDSVLLKHAKGVIEGLRELYDEVAKARRERDDARRCAVTLVVNLRNGSTPEEILRWYETTGRALVMQDEAANASAQGRSRSVAK